MALLCLLLTIAASARQVKEIPLKEALQLIGKEWNIQFAYESSLVDKWQVKYDWSGLKESTPEKVLAAILPPCHLAYERISGGYFTIIREKKSMLQGKVISARDSTAVIAASVSLPQLGLTTMSDNNGVFSFTNIPEGNWNLHIQHLAMEPMDMSVNGSEPLTIVLNETQLGLKEIQVVAIENKSGQPTSSQIGQLAIEHLQAASLSDVMQLLPGVPVANPDLANINKFAIRQVGVDNMGSLGTAVLVNGVPMSNNANLQAINPAAAGANANFSTTTGTGIDLRAISADNIESVEVIRGVPSVEYGDLTSGAIIVKTKAGKSPLQAKIRINPRLTQFWAGKGLDLGKRYGNLNIDVDYSKAIDDQRFAATEYNRITTNLLHSVKLGKLYTTTGASFGMNLDQRKQDPDDASQKIALRAQNYSFHLHNTGRWNTGKKFARMVTYMLSADYGIQKGFQQQQVGGAIVPIITAMKDTTTVSQYAPSEYLSRVWIEGRPLNVLAKVTNSFYLRGEHFRHRVLMGAEWKMDVNKGPGKTYDVNRPPNPAADGNNSRPRAYSDIPALQQLSAYIEDNITFKDVLKIQAGGRFDKVGNVGMVFSPRVNLGYDITSNFSLRAGYGITAKAPTLLYLYPQDAYFDFINLNYYAQNEAERLLITTTRVINSMNPSLRMAVNHKKELGIDWHFAPDKRLTLTAYHEHIRHGYSFNTTLGSVRVVDVAIDTVLEKPNGTTPVATQARTVTRFADFNTAINDVDMVNKGVEFDLDFGKVAALRTSFVLNGAYMQSRSVSTNYYILKMASATAGSVDPSKMAVFAPGRGSQNDRMLTTLRMIHHIPALRFIVTLSAQTTWISKNKYLNYDSIPVGYIQRDDAAMVWLDEQARSKITASDKELFLHISKEYYKTESWSPLFLFNVRLTKEIGRHITFSFYANNMLKNNPIQESNRWAGTFTRRNVAQFFGSEIKFSF